MGNQNEFIGPFYVQQAGSVIFATYLPMLFERCGYLENGSFKSNTEQYRAYGLVYYTATGSTINKTVENPLIKILCGIPILEEIPDTITITTTEKEMVDGMLNAIIQSWTAVGTTTIEGLRGSFLVRDGKLEINETPCYLTVEQKAFDMLLDQLPWSISTIKFSWMEKPLQVQWR